MKLWKRLGWLLCVLVAGAVGVVVAAGMGWFGRHEEPGVLTERPLPGEVVAGRVRAQRAAAAALGAAGDRQILFGDLHAHTTFSVDAFVRREVYGTSGPRILLWFDLLNDPAAADGVLPMGGQARMATAPEFRVRAVGSLEQKPGCPHYATSSLSPERIHHLCRGECYNPGDERRLITRIEVVRILPQNRPDEPVAQLIADPWRVIPCEPDPAGCTVTFSDADFTSGGRDALYYVRAIEEPSLAVNADNLRCTRDAAGRCIEVKPCWGDYRVPYQEDCLAETEERAWSSPVFVAFGGEGR